MRLARDLGQSHQPFQAAGITLAHKGRRLRIVRGIKVAQALRGGERSGITTDRVIVQQAYQAAAHPKPFLIIMVVAVSSKTSVGSLMSDEFCGDCLTAIILVRMGT